MCEKLVDQEMSIWIANFPLPPSVNEYLMPVAGQWSINRLGKNYRKGKFVKTKLHTDYLKRCEMWRDQNKTGFDQIQATIVHNLDIARRDRKQFALKVDCYFAFERSRIWTTTGLPERIDADNRLKPCLDALAKLIGIDDKHIFSGFFEKITTNSKELECAYLRISPVSPRTLDDLKNQIKMEKTQDF